jgi:hypothetical protein
MRTKKLLARVGGVLALFAMLALPLASCGEARLTGADMLLRVEEHAGLKLLVGSAVLAAILAIFIVRSWASVIFGMLGIGVILYSGIALHANEVDRVRLLGGSLIAFVGYAIVLLAGLLPNRDTS